MHFRHQQKIVIIIFPTFVAIGFSRHSPCEVGCKSPIFPPYKGLAMSVVNMVGNPSGFFCVTSNSTLRFTSTTMFGVQKHSQYPINKTPSQKKTSFPSYERERKKTGLQLLQESQPFLMSCLPRRVEITSRKSVAVFF